MRLPILHGVRPLGDYEVDRPEVYARQRVQPTGTNRPRTWLIARARYGVPGPSRRLASSMRIPVPDPPLAKGGRRFGRHRFGGYSGGETPGPIPNPEVKPSSADGTALVTGWESRSPPRLFAREGPHLGALLLFRVRFVGTMPRDLSSRRNRPGGRGASRHPDDRRARGTTHGRVLGGSRLPAKGARGQATRPVPAKEDRPTPAARSLAEEIRAAARPGQADRALQAFERAVGLLERGRDGAAAQAAEEAKNLAPRSGAVREVLGIALYRAERYREALRELQAYRRMTGRLDHNHLIADSYRALGSPEKPIESARAAFEARIPQDARAEGVVG